MTIKKVFVRNDYSPKTNIAKLFIEGRMISICRELAVKIVISWIVVTNFRDCSKHMTKISCFWMSNSFRHLMQVEVAMFHAIV